jgi:hypothetical protein
LLPESPPSELNFIFPHFAQTACSYNEGWRTLVRILGADCPCDYTHVSQVVPFWFSFAVIRYVTQVFRLCYVLFNQHNNIRWRLEITTLVIIQQYCCKEPVNLNGEWSISYCQPSADASFLYLYLFPSSSVFLSHSFYFPLSCHYCRSCPLSFSFFYILPLKVGLYRTVKIKISTVLRIMLFCRFPRCLRPLKHFCEWEQWETWNCAYIRQIFITLIAFSLSGQNAIPRTFFSNTQFFLVLPYNSWSYN